MTELISRIGVSSALVLASACSSLPPPPPEALVHPMPPAFIANGMLVTSQGMTLYTFDQDTQGTSTCAGDCLQSWTPFEPAAADAPSGDFTILARDDGSRQWAYKGKPVYLFKRDSMMGDVAGEKTANAWHAVREGM